MTGRAVLSPRAQGDLEDIWDYTMKRWGLDQAEFYARQIWQHIEAAARRPTIGRPCPEVRAGYYKYPSGSHILFYRRIDGDIDIVRILHKRMDFGQHF
jgi:toxin ParE1/3/4